MKSCTTTARLLSAAGFQAAALTLPSGLLKDRVRSLRNRFAEVGIETFVRMDINCVTRQELLRLLRHFRNLCDVVAVKCVNHAVGLVAARDRRVDIIFFDPMKRAIWFDHSIANVSQAALEINLSVLLLDGIHFTQPIKEVNIARDHNVRIVLSSGSTSPMMIRTPQQLSAIGMMLGLNVEQARDGITTIPWSILEQNIERRSSQYVEQGVKVIRRLDA